MAIPVPQSPVELTPEWLNAVLGPAYGAAVTAVRPERVGASTGFLGVLTRLHLDWAPDGAGPATVVAKLPTTDPGGWAVGRMLDVWARESAFFADLAPGLDARIPACLANLADRDAGRWCLLLEDRPAGQPADQVRGATQDQAEVAVRALARFQAPLWGGPRPVGWLPGFDRPRFEALQAAMDQALGPFHERFAATVPRRTLDWLARFVARLPEWAAAHAAGPLTLVHADYRLDNLIFDAAGEVTIVDWQTALWGPGPMDLASFCATSLTVGDRRTHERALLEGYADELRAGGATIGQAEIADAYRSCLLWWMAIFANNLSRIDPADERARTLFEAMVSRTFAAADDTAAGDLL